MRIAIIGASLSGLASALLLKQCGLEPELFEEKQSLSEAYEWHQSTFIWPQGVEVLRSVLGQEKLMRAGQPVNGIGIHNASGQQLYQLAASIPLPDYTSCSFVFNHQKLLQLMLEALYNKGIKFGTSCQKISSVNQKSLIHFDDGSIQPFDLVINADETNTLVQEFISGTDPYDTGMAITSGVSNFDNALLDQHNCQMFLGDSARLITHCASGGNKQRFWSLVYQHNDQTLWKKANLPEQLKNLPRPLLEMVNSSNEDTITQRIIYSFSNRKNWYRDQYLTLNTRENSKLDPLGYGTSLALENAFVLSRDLFGCDIQALPWVLHQYKNKATANAQTVQTMMDEVTDLYYQSDEYAIYCDFKRQSGMCFPIQKYGAGV